MIKFDGLKPTSQGTIGVGVAIGYFCSKGYIVSVPLSDNQKYDLLVDIDGIVKKVQVKTTGYKRRGRSVFTVQLKTVCPKKTSKNQITNFDNKLVDFLFVLTVDGDMYNIPTSSLTSSTELFLTPTLDRYKVGLF